MIDKYKYILKDDLNGLLFDSIIAINIEMLRILVEKYKVNINIKTHINSTPLMFASYIGNLDMVKYLCDNGAKTSIKNIYGNDVYFYGNKEILDYLYNRKKIYLIMLIEGSHIDIHRVLETSKERLGIYIKNNTKILLKFFMEIFTCDTITSKLKKYIDSINNFLLLDDLYKVEYINQILLHFSNKDIVNEFVGYNLIPHKLVKIHKINTSVNI
jgi:hypothetical protein